MQFYTKNIGDLTCVGPDGLTQARPEKAVQPLHTSHVHLAPAQLNFIEHSKASPKTFQ